MALNPVKWVDDTITEYKNPPWVVFEMIESMKPEYDSGITMPEWWINEAFDHLKRRYAQ